MTKSSAPAFAEVAPAVPLPPGRATYTYRLPKQADVSLFSAVTIPFGPRRVPGVVLEVHSRRPRYPLKPLSAPADVRLTNSQVLFAQAIARTMHAGLGFTLRLFLPPASSRPVSPVKHERKTPRLLRGRASPDTKTYLQTLSSGNSALIEGDADKRSTLLKNLAMAYARQSKKTVLIIVPEKAHLRHWEGWPIVTADLARGKIATIWQEAGQGNLPVIVGTQKALFLPFANLGLIVVEEEAWPTHKLWDQYPRLHSSDAARMLAKIHEARIVWSGSFPSVRLQADLQAKRVTAPVFHPVLPRPEVHLFSRADYANKNVLPHALIAALRPGLVRQRPTLLLYNSLQADKIKDVRRQLHRALGKHFAHLTLATTVIFAKVRPGDFQQSAWLFPEGTFSYPDFRSEEHGLVTLSRLQQLLPSAQKVHIATRSLTLAQRLLQWQALDWYDTLLTERRLLGYPPYTDALKLTVTEKTATKAARRASALRDTLTQRSLDKKIPVRIQGPFTALGAAATAEASQHLLLLGDVTALPDLYHDLKIDSVDLSPHKIL